VCKQGILRPLVWDRKLKSKGTSPQDDANYKRLHGEKQNHLRGTPGVPREGEVLSTNPNADKKRTKPPLGVFLENRRGGGKEKSLRKAMIVTSRGRQKKEAPASLNGKKKQGFAKDRKTHKI